VLAAGTPAPAYATDLLAVAHGARGAGGSNPVAIGMARRSHLEGRLLAVLDESRRRGAGRGKAPLAALATTLLLLLPLAGLEARFSDADASATPLTVGTAAGAASGPVAAETSKPPKTEKPAKSSEPELGEGDFVRKSETTDDGHTIE